MELSRRELLLEEMLAELARKGYAEVSVEEARAAAGVSESEFEAEFASKDECLFAAYDAACEEIVKKVSAGCEETGGEWPARVRGGLSALLAGIAARPAEAGAILRDFPAIGPAAYGRYCDLLSRLAAMVAEGRECSEMGGELPEEVELLAVGAAESIVFAEVDAGRAERLPGMMPEVLFSLLVQFIGPERAAEEMRSAAAV